MQRDSNAARTFDYMRIAVRIADREVALDDVLVEHFGRVHCAHARNPECASP